MILYSHPVSQHARRVRILCHELGLSPEERNLDLQAGEQRSEEFLRINPAGQIPVLIADDLTLTESHAIMRYLARTREGEAFYPGPMRPRIDRWLDWTHCALNPHVDRLAIAQFMSAGNADPDVVAECHAGVGKALAVFEQAFDLDQVTLADFAIFSTIGLYLLLGGSMAAAPRGRQRFEMLSGRESFAATAPQL